MNAPLTDEKMTPQQVAADIAREYREDAARWTQDWYAKDANGEECSSRDPIAVCWCLRGAIERRVGDWGDETQTFRAFDAALGHEPEENHLYLVEWNDEPGRTVAEVIALCEKVAAS